jgi:hypothetical protein
MEPGGNDSFLQTLQRETSAGKEQLPAILHLLGITLVHSLKIA